MISPRNFMICLVCLAACTSPKKEAVEEEPTEQKDSIETETPRLSHHDTGPSKAGLTFDIDSSVYSLELKIFGKTESIPFWMSKFYAQDRLVKSKTDTPSYSIKSVVLTEDEYSNVKGECIKRPVLMVQRVLSGEEYYDIHFLTNDSDIISEKVTYDGSIAQSTGSVSLSNDFKLTKKCPALAIVREYEGGDIDYGRMKEISFFIVTESGMESVFDLVREYTLAKDYEVTGDEKKNSTSEVRDFEILRAKTNNFYDIKVHTTTKKDGKVTEETNTIFRFDGEKYSDKSVQ